ncbi:MAG: DUF2254 domain-containing protein [Candidatus Limnocylindria bacterium]
MPFKKVLDTIRQSLWFVPGLWVVGCTIAAFSLVVLDTATPELASELPLVFGGGPEGARGLLSSIASSMITVAGVVFSITIVALQLASSQYSPRVLRSFMRDRPSQIVLGSFIGAFVYAILVLRTIRSEQEGSSAFVPALAVTGAIVLSLVALAMLVYYIHHIATRMQASQITAAVATEALDEVARQRRAADEHPQPAIRSRPSGEPTSFVPATRSGYLQYVEADALVEIAAEHRMTIRLEAAPGDWVQQHTPLFGFWDAEPSDEIAQRLHRHVAVGTERVMHQDPGFGIQQLVDIAVKALSPGINDPTTAINGIHRITEILVAAGRAGFVPQEHTDDEGTVRLVMPRTGFEELLWAAFEEIIHFGAGVPTVARAVVGALDDLSVTVDAEHRSTLDEVRASLRTDRDAR